jgi:quaternary ammonium compound-resistance protein SugE
MNWFFLLMAGLLEIVWAIGLKYTDGFTRTWPSIGTLIALVTSVFLLSVSMKTLPVGIAYTVWVGIGTIGTVILGFFLFDESINLLKLISLLLIISGVVLLKFAH